MALYGTQVDHVGDIKVSRDGRVQFYDAGECFETIKCPACQSLVAANPSSMDWFIKQTDRCWTADEGFWPLDVVMPCCQHPTTLNDLIYEAPQGFALWSMGAVDAQQWDLADWKHAELEAALGHSLRLVYAHY